MDGDEWDVEGGSGGLAPLVVRQAIAAVLADRLPLAADAVLVGTLAAEQLYALEEGVQQLTREGHGPDVIAELERRLVGLAAARRGADLAGPAAEYCAGVGEEVGTEEVLPGPAGSGPADGEPARVEREDPSSEAGTDDAGAAPADGVARDGATGGTSACRRRPGRGRGTVPSGGRAMERGPPRPERVGLRAERPVLSCGAGAPRDRMCGVSTFDDLDAFAATRRCAGLALSPDGSRLVTTVSELAADGKSYGTALWELDPAGERAPRRLTRSSAGESSAAFTPGGDLLFTSRRADPTAEKPTEDRTALWSLPAAGGEARPVAERPGGVSAFAVARDAGTVTLVTPKPVVGDAEEQREARESAGVSARLHTHFPVRFWDHDLGPGQAHLQRCAPPDPADPDAVLGEPEHLAPGAGERLGGSAVSPDGRTVAVVVDVPDAADPASWRRRLELHTDAGRVVVGDEPGADHEAPTITPDGRWLLWVRERHPRPGRGMAHTLRARSLEDAARGIVTEVDVLPAERWQVRGVTGAPGGDVVYVVVDELGHAPVLRVSITDGSVTRLTRSGAYTDVVAAPDGSALYALRSAVDAPPTPVRLDPGAADQEPAALRGVTAIDPLPGTLTEVHATAADGTALRAWLVLPGGASASSPAPLVLWIHGGPLSSWNAWSWRWNPWLMAARGWAVLLPDPRLSTGYGQEFLDPATGAWGELPYTDLMTATDAALARDDVDASHVAAMGGSFGGYMANWIAGHTERFAAIVTHASIWHLDGFVGTTDASFHWRREWGDPLEERERYDAHSPHRHVRAIRTPMLVIHGDKDYRVPIGEGLRLWYDLQRSGVESQFLYYPDENHWVLKPGDAKLWYRTVWAFLDHHVLARPWERPALV